MYLQRQSIIHKEFIYNLFHCIVFDLVIIIIIRVLNNNNILFNS